METVETFKPVFDPGGKFYGLDHETIFYDPDAFVAPARAAFRFQRVATADDPERRYTFIECLSQLKNVNGRPVQLAAHAPRLHRLLQPTVGQELGEVVRSEAELRPAYGGPYFLTQRGSTGSSSCLFRPPSRRRPPSGRRRRRPRRPLLTLGLERLAVFLVRLGRCRRSVDRAARGRGVPAAGHHAQVHHALRRHQVHTGRLEEDAAEPLLIPVHRHDQPAAPGARRGFVTESREHQHRAVLGGLHHLGWNRARGRGSPAARP